MFAKVSAINIVSSSDLSNAGNGAILLTNPDPPVLLSNMPSTTSSTVIGLTWSSGTNNGGTPVIDFRVSWD